MTLASFLSVFRQANERLHLRAFKPTGAKQSDGNKPKKWSATLAGLPDLLQQLSTANQTRGIYFVVNAGGCTDAEITRYTAFFAEDDKRSVEEQHEQLNKAPIRPSIRVETRKSVHAYWLVDGPCRGVEWRDVQARLIQYFGGDPKIKNPSRVMRLPGFDHLHLNGNGEERTKVTVHTFEPERRHTVAQMCDAFPMPDRAIASPRYQARNAQPFKYHEDRHEELCQGIMSRGQQNSKGNWDARCLAHGGNGTTGLVFFPTSGAVKCNAVPACGYFSILAAEGLPIDRLPSREFVRKNAPKGGAIKTKVWTATELLAREFPEPRWAVHNLIPEGVTIFAAPPKVGKTWAGLGFAVAVASGGRALGAIPVQIGDALYLGLEDGAKRLRDRLRLMLGGDSVPDRLFLGFTWPRLDEGGLEAIEGWLKDHPQTRLIIIDTLKRVRPVEHQRERIYNADYDAIGPLGDLARKYGVAVVVIHHTRKMYSPDPLDLVSGSLGLTGAADGVLVLKRARGEVDATLHATGRDFEDQEIALKWNKEVMGWRLLGDAAEFKRSNERQEVIALLRTSDPLTPKAVSELLGRQHAATKKLLWTMARDGDLQVDGKGGYSLPRNSGNPGNRGASGYPDGCAVTAVTEAFPEELPNVTTPADLPTGVEAIE